MVVMSVGGAWLTTHLLLLLLFGPPDVTSSSAASDVTTDVTAGRGMQGDSSSGSRGSSGPEWVPNGDVMPKRETAAEEGRMIAGKSSGLNSFQTEDVQVGCRELWAKRYISDGFCTSVKPLQEVVCAGHCLPIRDLPWYAEFVALWTKSRLKQWQCVESVVRQKAVNLLCRNGEYRTYRIKVVKACKCEQIEPKRNRTERPGLKKSKRRRKGRKRGGRRKKKKKKKKKKKTRGGEKRKPEAEVQEREGQSVNQRQESEGERESVRDPAQRRSEDVRQSSGSESQSPPGEDDRISRDRSQGL